MKLSRVLDGAWLAWGAFVVARGLVELSQEHHVRLLAMPGRSDVHRFVFWMLAFGVVEISASAILRRNPSVGRIALLTSVLTCDLFMTEGARSVLWGAFIIWTVVHKFPWDRWRKGLGSKLSSLTEVATAALRRQTSEAFS